MHKFDTGAVRDTGGKGRMDLLPMCSLLRISKHMEDALTHYPERNWENALHAGLGNATSRKIHGWVDRRGPSLCGGNKFANGHVDGGKETGDDGYTDTI